MVDDDSERESKRATLMARMHPAQGEQLKPPQQVPAPRDLSQMRPEVIRAVGEQERRAEQVVTATAQLFGDMIRNSNDPALKKSFRESSMNSMLEMV